MRRRHLPNRKFKIIKSTSTRSAQRTSSSLARGRAFNRGQNYSFSSPFRNCVKYPSGVKRLAEWWFLVVIVVRRMPLATFYQSKVLTRYLCMCVCEWRRWAPDAVSVVFLHLLTVPPRMHAGCDGGDGAAIHSTSLPTYWIGVLGVFVSSHDTLGCFTPESWERFQYSLTALDAVIQNAIHS